MADAAIVIDAGRSVILDATFSSGRWRDAAAQVARDRGARFALVEARCADRDILRARLASRRHAASVSDATDELLAGMERASSRSPQVMRGHRSPSTRAARPRTPSPRPCADCSASALSPRGTGARRSDAGALLAIHRGMEKPLPKTILLATDFSDGSNEALQRAIALARLSGGTLEIVHVIEPGVEDPFGGHIYGSDHHSAVDRMLARLALDVETGGLACTVKALEGNAATEITKRARTIGADTIVVGTHGRTGLAHVLLGSIAERVVRHASCPVLTVPFSKKLAA